MPRSFPLQQLDTILSPWRSRPSGGWLRAVRLALGMTTHQLPKVVGVTQAAVVDRGPPSGPKPKAISPVGTKAPFLKATFQTRRLNGHKPRSPGAAA